MSGEQINAQLYGSVAHERQWELQEWMGFPRDTANGETGSIPMITPVKEIK